MTERSVFLAALELDDPAARSAYLDRACAGDPALRAGVEQLLAAHQAPGDFLDRPAPGGTLGGTVDFTPARDTPGEPAPETSGTERPGEVLAGRYELLEAIGEGGMGTVWRARQTEPVKRQVAVKLIKAGMDSGAVLERFNAERQALALMDHPNIAKVLDAGDTPDGRPFFVMELVQGVPITRYCDEHRLTPRQRLELMIPVCQAIQHAHHKGVIHRDIKPSNVLVARHDDRPVPQVIDFGVAKATGQPLTEQTLHTGLGMVVGTLEYMSPEQAELNQLDIDTRSDVYSLGVLLYELLTGTPPLDRKRLKKAAMLEVLRLIREEEPPKPSSRLSTADELPSIAANRDVEPRKLSGLVRGELDWVVMKCLEKDRNRRYETANVLASDIQRYLHDEPVLAGPPSATYRLRKFLRRNRVLVGAAAVVLLALVGGIIGMAVGYVQAEQARAAAEVAEQKERDERRDKEKALGKRLEVEEAKNEALKGWRKTAYYNWFALAQHAYQANNLARAEEMLGDGEKCPEDLRGFEWHYLRRLCRSERSRFQARRPGQGHYDGRYGHGFTPDGRRLAALYGAGVDVYDTATGERTFTFTVGNSLVGELAFSPDGRLLALCSESTSHDVLSLWDTATGANLARLSGLEKQYLGAHGLSGASFSPDGRLVAGTDKRGNLFVWDLEAVRGRLSAGPAGCIGQGFGVPAVAPAGAPLGPLALALGALAAARADPLAPHHVQNVFTAENPYAPRIQLMARLIGRGFAAQSAGPAGAPLGSLLPTLGALASARADPLPPRLQVAAHPLPGTPTNRYWIAKPAFSPDSKWVVTASEGDESVRLWDAATGKLVRELGTGVDFTRVAFSPKGTWVAAAAAYESQAAKKDLSVLVWEAKTGRTHRVLRGQSQPVTCLAFSPDEQLLATGSRDGTLTVWHVATAQELSTYRGHKDVVVAVAFSPDGQRVLTLDNDDVVRTWDATRRPEWLALGCRGAWQATFSSDGRRVAAAAARHATADLSATVVWDAETGRELAMFGARTEAPAAVALSPDGLLAAAAVTRDSTNGVVRVWDVPTGQIVRGRTQAHFLGQYLGAEAVAPAAAPAGGPLGPLLLRFAATRGVSWEMFGLVRSLSGPGPAACDAVAWSPDGKCIASGGQDRVVRLWDAATGKELWAHGGHTRTISAVAFSRDGSRLASASGGLSRTWPPLEPNPLKIPSDSAADVPDAKVWDVASGKELRSFSLPDKSRPDQPGFRTVSPPGKGPGLALSPDGETVAVTFGETGMDVKEVTFLDGGGTQVMKTTYAETYSDVVRLYRVATGEEVVVLKGHTRPPYCVAFSPDGRRVVTGGGTDETIKLWDARTGEEIMTVGRHPDLVTGVAFSPDGLKIVSTSRVGAARIWDATPQKK